MNKSSRPLAESNRFYGWWLLGRSGVFRRLGIDYERSVFLSADHSLLFAIVGRLWILHHNTKWRLRLLREIFRARPRLDLR